MQLRPNPSPTLAGARLFLARKSERPESDGEAAICRGTKKYFGYTRFMRSARSGNAKSASSSGDLRSPKCSFAHPQGPTTGIRP